MADFINIGVKEDSPAKLAYIAENSIPEKYYVSAANIMLIVWAINQLKATAFTGSYNDLSDKPVLFIDWIAGSYNAGQTVFHNGGIWISKSNDNTSEPALGATNWKLLAQINEGGVLGVNWENITGSQSAVSLSGFTNDGDGLHPFITAQDLSAFVQKIEGKGLSTNDFSDEFRNKLSSLVSSKFVGTYPNIEDLIEAYPEGLVGGYADVGVPGELVVRYEWSQSTYSWVIKESGSLIEGLIAKVNGIEEGAQVNKIEKVFVNGVEQAIENKEVRIEIEQNMAMIIKSQPVIVTHVSGNNYAITAHASNTDEIIWQSPTGTVYEQTEDFVQMYTIDKDNFNVVHCIWLDYDGSVGIKLGTQVATGIAPSYPTPPPNALGYSFVTFIGGIVSAHTGVTPEQLQEVIDSMVRSNHIEINDNYTLLDSNSGKDVYLFGNGREITIPSMSGLLKGYNQAICFLGTGGTVLNPNGLTVNGLPAGVDFPLAIPKDGVVRFVRLENFGNPILRIEGDIL